MADVIFNPDQNNGFDFRGGRDDTGSTAGFITKLAMKLTGIQDEKQINQALIGLAVLCFIGSAIVLWSSF
jgi:hypothetical protein